jgi:quercetin dioxygenase-like cupin family protein
VDDPRQDDQEQDDQEQDDQRQAGQEQDDPDRYDLDRLCEEHLARARADAHGRSAHLVLHQGPLRQTVIALTAGSALVEHNAPLAASVQALRGSVVLTAAGGDLTIGEGTIQAVPQERHGLRALEDAVVLLTAVTAVAAVE